MFAPPRLFQEIDDLSLPSHKKTYIYIYTVVFRQLTLLRVISPMVFSIWSDISCESTRSLDTVTEADISHFHALHRPSATSSVVQSFVWIKLLGPTHAQRPSDFLPDVPPDILSDIAFWRLVWHFSWHAYWYLIISYLTSLLTSSLAFLLTSYDIHSGMSSDICNLTFKRGAKAA